MLTKEQKEKWLKALKSGKYKQGKGTLYNKELNEHCCIAVLAVSCGIPISDDGYQCVVNGYNKAYLPIQNIIGIEPLSILWRKNDKSYNEGIRDYSAVIPLIEKLETE